MLKKLNSLPRRYRWPIKWAVLGLTAFLVCYPYPQRFFTHVRRWRNPNALINADARALKPLAAQLRETLTGTDGPQRLLESVERCVNRRVSYAFDWETWGVADYLPTVDEVLAGGREDCDGRAVLAASLLHHMGYTAELVTDFVHVWVRTDHGEFMGPRPHKAVVATERGLKVDWGWRLIADYADAVAYGVAVFPMLRQIAILVVAWLVLIGPGTSRRAAIVAGLLLLVGLLAARMAGPPPGGPIRWLQWFGFAVLIAGVSVQALSGQTTPHRVSSSGAESVRARRGGQAQNSA